MSNCAKSASSDLVISINVAFILTGFILGKSMIPIGLANSLLFDTFIGSVFRELHSSLISIEVMFPLVEVTSNCVPKNEKGIKLAMPKSTPRRFRHEGRSLFTNFLKIVMRALTLT